MKHYINTKCWWYIYILLLDNQKPNRKFYGKTKIYYTGISMDIGERLGTHIFRKDNGFVNTVWRDAMRIPKHIEYLYGTEQDAMEREKSIKKLGTAEKEFLIKSEKNLLRGYKPLRWITVRAKDTSNEEVIRLK